MSEVKNTATTLALPHKIDSFVGKKVWITGHRGMLGAAVVRSFANEGANLLLTSRAQLDLRNQAAVMAWMEMTQPELIFHVGAKVDRKSTRLNSSHVD